MGFPSNSSVDVMFLETIRNWMLLSWLVCSSKPYFCSFDAVLHSSIIVQVLVEITS